MKLQNCICMWALKSFQITKLKQVHMGANILKRTKGAKVKVHSKDYIWHMAFLCWSIFLWFAFFIPILQVHCARYNIYFIAPFILCIQALNNIKMNNFCWKHIFEIHNFQDQKHVWNKCVQMCFKVNFTNFKYFFF